MRARWAALSLLLLSVSFSPAAGAQGELRGVKVVVPKATGKVSAGGAALMRSLRRDLKAGGAQLIDEKRFAKSQRKLKLRGKAKNEPEALARAAEPLEAQYVLTIDISQKGWAYTARAQLVSVKTAEVKMDFKSGYYKPKQEAGDRGERIARVTLERLAALVSDEPAVAAVPAPQEDRPPPRVEEPPPDDRLAADPPRETPPPMADAPPDDGRVTDPPPREEPVAIAPAPPIEERREAPPPIRDDDEDTELFRATVLAGSRLLHSFSLGSEATPDSALSYRLEPLAAFAGDLEVLIPSMPIGVMARGSFSPARFRVVVLGANESQPRGSLLDLAFGLRLHFALSGEGREAVELIPIAGLRLETLSVDKHTADVMHGNSMLAPFAGLELRLPLSDAFEASIAAEGGFVASYEETPRSDGDLGSGLLIGGGLGAKWWMSRGIGIALDGRFDLRSIKLEGASERAPGPPGENLTDVDISTRDLRVTLGLAFRI